MNDLSLKAMKARRPI